MLSNKILQRKIYKHITRSFYTEFFNISNIYNTQKIGAKIKIKGWVKSLRNQKDNVFIDLSDGSTDKKLQIFVPQNIKPEGLTAGSSISASGFLKLSPKGQIELTADNVEVYGTCVISEGYPFAPRKEYAPEYIRQYLHFRPRTNKFSALLRIRNAATLAIHNHLNSEGFINVHTPILTSNDCEGAGEIFKVLPENADTLKSMLKPKTPLDEAYFDGKAFLTVSGQLHLEVVAHGLSKVYCFGPTFRAENSRSRLHLSEFYMLEAEMAFVFKLQEVMNVIEKLIKYVTENLVNNLYGDIESCREVRDSFSWIHKKFRVLTYDEAVIILNENKHRYKDAFNASEGFSKEHEIFLVKYCGEVPTFIIDWPKSMKPFYMKECDYDNTKVAALDLLAPNVGEIVGGSLREDNYEKLKNKIPNKNLDWYLDIRKFGGVPTGGFGMGFERYLQFILGISNIKDTIPFPRWPHNCTL